MASYATDLANQYQVIKLRRLLHCMTHDDLSPSSISSSSSSSSSSPEEIKNGNRRKIAIEQINLANRMLEDVKVLAYRGMDTIHTHTHTHAHDTNSIHNNRGDFTQMKEEVQAFIQRLELAVQEASSIVSERDIRPNDNNNEHPGGDLVDDIFFKEEDEDEEEEIELSFDDNSGNIENTDDDYSFCDDGYDENKDVIHGQQSSSNANTSIKKSINNSNNNISPLSPKKKLTREEQQKQQEEQLQNEISEMAAHLKQSTMNINSTLATQNKDLDNVEELAQNNLDKTKIVKEEVTDHVKATGWRKGFGRWVIFFVVLSTWVFCFLTIRVIPKRKGACLFFCEDSSSQSKRKRTKVPDQRVNNNDYDDNYYEYYGGNDDDDDGDVQDNESTSSQRTVQPKYSYCQNSGDKNNKQCTAPDDLSQHINTINRINKMSERQSEVFLEKILHENKHERYLKNLNKAQQEQDTIGMQRVREGWDLDNDDSNNNGDDGDHDRYYDDDDEDEIDTTFTYENAVSAACNDAPTLSAMLIRRPDIIKQVDQNGWSLIHEASRAGNIDSVSAILRFIDDVNDVNVRTSPNKTGGNALWLAKSNGHHKVVQLLVEWGGIELPPVVKSEL